LALHSLKKEFAGKVKLIYIDPPYNTGNDGFKYNDSFNHSTWLTFMKNRLEIAKQLLKDDGVIFVQCDDNEQAYLKVLMDEVFGRENFVNLVTVKTKIAGVSGSSEGGSLQDNCEYLNIYSKQRSNFKIENNLFDKIELNTFIKEYKNNSKSWKYTTVLEYCDKGEYLKSIKAGNGEEIKIFVHKKYSFKSINQIAKEKYKNNLEDAFYGEINNVFRTTNAQSSIRTRVMDLGLKDELISIEYEPTKGKNKGKTVKLYFKDEIRNLITFLSDVVSIEDNRIYKLEKKGTLWDTINYNNLTKDGLVEFQNGKKPEELLRMVIELCTQRNDIVLDYHLGSGTTAAVAHKMGRQYIGIEQMDYIETIAVERLKKVVEGEQGGISKSVNWQGGGSFVYLELKKYNETFIEQIEKAQDTETLLQIWEQMKDKSFLNYNVDIKKQDEHIEEFKKLSLKEQKQHLCEILDKNQLYVNLSSLNDADFECTEEEKRVTKDFYKLSASRINQM
jgi:adenine-specific DNA-methyltransferase